MEPALKQIKFKSFSALQLLMVISVILERNPELEFQDKVDLDKVVQEAFHDFQKDHNRPKGAEHQVSKTQFTILPVVSCNC